MSNNDIWQACLTQLGEEFKPEAISRWLHPLHAIHTDESLKLLAPNRYSLNYIRNNLFSQIEKTAFALYPDIRTVTLEIGSYGLPVAMENELQNEGGQAPGYSIRPYTGGKLNPEFTFEKHVEGTSNQLARAAAMQVGTSPGQAYNPLFIYGGVGLGKTHLMQAAGNLILEKNPGAKVVYVRSELFVSDMVKAIKNSSMNEFKRYYRSLDALLIDDIQFFARKTQSQEEFFHTFNTLLEGQRQIVITSDRFPKEISGVEERLISRFGSGLTVSIEPPELETRVAILQKKALERGIELPDDVAFFVSNTISSNVRELEGALHRIIASARFT
ncbi:MAG: chromosomal replication initiator protein DnaA, partial [Pseudomonadota bacterium]|nr:chromosomal replication initiator protein DnaA [Pseudomonadota bacterium]